MCSRYTWKAMLVCSVGHRMQTHRPIHNSYSIFDFVYGLMKTVRWVDCMDGSITSVARRPGAESASAAKLWSAAWRQRAAYRPIDNITPPHHDKDPLYTTNPFYNKPIHLSTRCLQSATLVSRSILWIRHCVCMCVGQPFRKSAIAKSRHSKG